MKKGKRTFYLAIILFLSVIQAKAHPHLFIDADITISLDSIGIDYLEVSFAFDKMYSNDLISRFDKDKNNCFSNDEIKNIQENAFSNLVNYNYFTHIFYHNKEIKLNSVSDFMACIKDDVVVYSFKLKPNITISNNTEIIKIAPYDHTYYIDVSLNSDNVVVDNTYGYYYSYDIIEDKQLAYYYDQIYPDCIVLNIKKL